MERGDDRWLALAFHELPLEALLSTRPLTGDASETASEVHPPGQSHNPELTGTGTGLHFDAVPVAVLEKQRVLLANEAATGLGVRPGMSTATARTLAEGIRLLERDPAAEQRCLERLCCWAYSISPTLYPHRGDSLLLEIGSCMRLYGSIEAMMMRIRRELGQRGHRFFCGLGPTPKSALLFARPLDIGAKESTAEALRHRERLDSEPLDTHAHESSLEGQTLEERLGPLPLKLLEDFPREVDALARAGLWTFGDILALPRQALARRCGREFTRYLEQLLGTAEDLVPDFQPPRQFSDAYWFGYEVKANQELLPAVELLLQSLCRFLRNTQLHTGQVTWLLYRIDRRVHRLTVSTSRPHTDWRAWYRLTVLKVEQLEPGESIEGVGLECLELTPGNASSDDLFRQAGQKEPMHSLLDRLKSRLGLQSVARIACRDEHLPEFAGYCSLDTRPGSLPADENGDLRPFWLMREPRRLTEHDGRPCWNGLLTLLEGPERIEDNWWDSAVSRDYYIARDGSGQQYWIYRDRLQNSWYLQGVFH